MPTRAFVSKELANLLGVLSHPHRIRIIEELRDGEKDVNSLQIILGVSHSGVSQHLSLLRSRRLVEERREGRHVFYHLSQPALARWLTDGLAFLEASANQVNELREAVEATKSLWTSEPPAADGSS